MNPSWEMLKYFNEEQFFHIIQETSKKSNIIGRFPKALELPKDQAQSLNQKSSSRSSLLHRYTDSYISSNIETSITEKLSNDSLLSSVITL